MASAHFGFVLLAILVIVGTLYLKAWRWQLLFYPPHEAPAGRTIFDAFMVGQFINILVPFVRLGEVARVYALKSEASKAKTAGTLVVEKTLDTIVLVMMFLLLLPFVVIPPVISGQGVLMISGVAVVALTVLYLLAYRTNLVVRWFRALARREPGPLGQRLVGVAVAGLEGLAALRDRRVTLLLLISSAIIGILSILTPWALFPAFGLQLGVEEATLINLAVTLGSLPPSTPARVGVFEAITAFMLAQFGITDRSLLLGYSLVFHLVVILPPILLAIPSLGSNGMGWSRKNS